MLKFPNISLSFTDLPWFRRLAAAGAIACSATAVVLSALLPGVSIGSMALFIVFAAVTLSAGYAAARFAAPSSPYELYALSLAAGVIVQLCCFMFSHIIGWSWLNYVLAALAGALGAYLFIKDFRAERLTELSVDPLLLLCCGGVCLIAFLGFSLPCMLPEDGGGVYIYQDTLYHIGNAANLVREYPNQQTIQFDGLDFAYHYVYHMFCGQIKLFCGTSAAAAVLVFSNLYRIPLVCFSAAALSKHLTGSSKAAALAVWFYYFTQKRFFWENQVFTPSGVDFAVAMLLCAMLIYCRILDGRIKPVGYAFLAAFVFFATGSKAAAGVTFTGMSIGMVIVAIIKKDNIRKTLISAGCAIASFVCSYLWFFTSESSEGNVHIVPLALLSDSCGRYGLDKPIGFIIDRLTEVFPSAASALNEVYRVSDAIIYVLMYSFIMVIPLAVDMLRNLKGFKRSSLRSYAFYGLLACGWLIALLTSSDGLSQLSFVYTTVPVVSVYAFTWLYENFGSQKRWVKLLLICLLLLSLKEPIWESGHFVKEGILNYASQLSYGQTSAPSSPNSISSNEYNAMCWLRDNTPEDSLIACDRHYTIPEENISPADKPTAGSSRYFYYSAFSERQFFFEGTAYLSRSSRVTALKIERYEINSIIYEGTPEDRKTALEDNGIDYVIVSRYIHPELVLDDLTVVFENPDITIYSAD